MNYDASFASNHDKGFQLEYFILTVDKVNIYHPMRWTSYKFKRATRFVLKSEFMAFVDTFYTVFTLKHDLKRMFSFNLPYGVLTNSQSLYDILTKISTTTQNVKVKWFTSKRSIIKLFFEKH